MQDFGPFCYLDPQKTGTKFVVSFLEDHIDLPVVIYEKHSPYRLPPNDAGKFFFISARNPVAWYKSLYSYGCDGKGGLAKRLASHGLSGLYGGTSDCFAEWVDFMLAPRNAEILREDYVAAPAELFGFFTFRFLVRAFFDAIHRLQTVRDASDLMDAWRKDALPQHIVRTETLNDDLAYLVQHQLSAFIRDKDAAMASLAVSPPINRSTERQIEVPPDILRRLQEREWFMFAVAGYPPCI